MIHFRVSTDVSLYKMFSVMEKVREQWSAMIEDYTVTQVTLDDVFVNFAKTQDDSQPLDPPDDQQQFLELSPRKSNPSSRSFSITEQKRSSSVDLFHLGTI